MNHPQIQTSELSDQAIKAIQEVLISDYYRLRESQDDIGKRQASAALAQAKKIEKFLDR